MIRHALGAEESATVGRDEQVVLDADATKIFIALDGVEIQEVAVRALGAPEVDQVGDEVDARLVGHHMSHFQAAAKAQAGQTKLI